MSISSSPRAKALKACSEIHKKTGYRSGFEVKIASGIKEDSHIKYEPTFISYHFEIYAKYKPDFVMMDQCILIEAKGIFTKDDRDKMMAIRECYPYLDIRMMFQNCNNKITSKLTYAGWCLKNNFKYCRGPLIPTDWFKKQPTVEEKEKFSAIFASNDDEKKQH